MAARKLQTEIDRTLKKVTEGVELFESIYDKMQNATNQTQKEKQETDLKTQIKRLQRLRDQIKTWIAGNEIKDKGPLVENRKLIETQMEKFKACEKEMKTKAFSKEGLIAAQKLDPKEREKAELSEWLSGILAELARQVEQTEAEIASVQVNTKRKKGATGGSKAEDLTTLNNRRLWHIGRIEIILRLVNNGSLSVDTVTALKEEISYFVESNLEEDFEENEYIYDELNLDEEEEAFRTIAEEANHSDDEQSMISDQPPRPISKEKSKPVYEEPPTSPIQKKTVMPPVRRPTEKPEPPKPPVPVLNFATQPMSSAVKAGLPPLNAPVKPILPPMRYAAAAGGSANPAPSPITTNGSSAAAAVASPLSTTTTAGPPLPSSSASSIPPPTPGSSVPSLPLQGKSTSVSASSPPASPSAASMSISASSPVASSIAPLSYGLDASSVADSNLHDSPAQSPLAGSQADLSPLVHSMANASLSSAEGRALHLDSTPLANGASKAISQPIPAPPGMVAPTPKAHPNGSSDLHVQQVPPSNPIPSPLPRQVQQFSLAPGVSSAAETTLRAAGSQSAQPSLTQGSSRNLPGSLGDLVSTFDAVKQKAAQRMANPEQMHKMLEIAMNGTPQAADTEKPKYHIPRSQFNTPLYYPQVPLSRLNSPTLFAQLDVETLFYVFYYLPGTYQQYLAAQQLKNQSWRFHVKYLTWFQRHSEPQAITEEYEQGVYVYFDWEGSWCQRKKSDFRFEYRYLSED